MIIDTHQHLWDLSKFQLVWNTDPNHKLNRDHLMPEYMAATDGLGISKTVYMEVGVIPEQQLAEAQYVVDLCERDDNPMVAAVVGGCPASSGFRDYLAELRSMQQIKGIRQLLHMDSNPKRECLTDEFVAGVRALGEQGLSFDICIRPGELSDATDLIRQCPDTNFILDHCGNIDLKQANHAAWEYDIARISVLDNVVCKVSGIIASLTPDTWTKEKLAGAVNHVISQFGWDRVMFAGDWPVCTVTTGIKNWLEALQWIVRDANAGDRQKLFHDNAARVYKLD